MEIKISTAGQGLLSITVDKKLTNWRIRNFDSVWKLLMLNQNNEIEIIYDENIAHLIHKDELVDYVAEKIGCIYETRRCAELGAATPSTTSTTTSEQTNAK